MLHRTPVTSGSLVQALEAAQGLREQGHRVTVLTRPDAAVERRCAEIDVAWRSQRLRHALDVPSMRRLVELVAERGVEVVHVHSGISLGIALGAAALGAEFALVANRASSFRPHRLLAKALRSPRVQRVVATSAVVRGVLLADAGVPETKVTVVPGSVDLERFDVHRARPLRARASLAVAATARLVCHVGVRDWKGWRHTLAALPEVRAAVPDAHLLLLGCPSERRRRAVDALVHEVGLTGHATAVAARSDMPDLLAACDVVVDASWAGTGTSGAVREAMALGRPVVATAVGGNAELVEHEVCGLVVPPRDAATLAAGIVRLLRDGELATRLGAAAREVVRREYSPALRALRLAAVYRAALAERAETRRG